MLYYLWSMKMKNSIKYIKNYYNLADCVKRYGEDIDKSGLWKSEEFIFQKYLKHSDSILDLGCGAGRTTINLYKIGYKNIIGLDLAPNLIHYAKSYCEKNKLNIPFVVGNATDLPYKQDRFDAVIFSYNGLMCIPGQKNRERALQEIYRVLKPNGLFIFTAQDRDNIRFKQSWIDEKQKWDNGEQDKNLEIFGDKFLPDENGYFSFLHFSSIDEIISFCKKHNFQIEEYVNNLKIGADDEKNHGTIFYVVRKQS